MSKSRSKTEVSKGKSKSALDELIILQDFLGLSTYIINDFQKKLIYLTSNTTALTKGFDYAHKKANYRFLLTASQSFQKLPFVLTNATFYNQSYNYISITNSSILINRISGVYMANESSISSVVTFLVVLSVVLLMITVRKITFPHYEIAREKRAVHVAKKGEQKASIKESYDYAKKKAIRTEPTSAPTTPNSRQDGYEYTMHFASQKAIRVLEEKEDKEIILPEPPKLNFETVTRDSFSNPSDSGQTDDTDITKLDAMAMELAWIIRMARANPSALIGWKISIKGYGIGVVVGIKKRLGLSTLFKVKLENGNIEMLSLQRAAGKGAIPFTPICKVSSE